MKHRQKKLSLSAAIIAAIFASSAWAGNGGQASADKPLNGTCTADADGTCTPQGVPQGGKAGPQGRHLAGTCSQDDPQGACLQEPKWNNSQNWQGNYQQGPHCPADGTCLSLDQPLAELSEAEITTLSFMREEEKLARDVYITLSEEWQRRIFANISKAEQRHMDQIKSLLDRYELPDPASEEVGVFTNTDLQDLYDHLVERGRTSQIEALQVGALIEEVDISDLQNAIAETDNPVLERMYSNLMNGSYNHLRAFVRNIEYSDYAYQAQSLPQDEVDDILNPAVVSRGLGIKAGDSQFVATNDQQGPHCPTDGTCLSLDQPLAELSEAEITTLSFMREEEKLARDVYITLSEEWQRRIFANISKAEQRHMDQIKSLLDRYELPDPASEEVGVFTNTDLQDLYDHLVERGRTSQIEALQVGALIEEVDISDLQNAIAETDNPVLERMYSNLMNGSYNHLRAFVRNIEYSDYAYQAQSLPQDEVDDILNPAVVSRGLGIKAGDSQFVATNAQFKHSLKNKNGRHANGAILAQSDEVTLGATFQPDIAHLGQNADLLTVATFTPMNSNRQMMFMGDKKG